MESSSLQISRLYSIPNLNCFIPPEEFPAFHWLFQISLIALIQDTIIIIILIIIKIKDSVRALNGNLSAVSEKDDIFMKSTLIRLQTNLHGLHKGNSEKPNPSETFNKSSQKEDQSLILVTEPDNKNTEIKITDFDAPLLNNDNTQSKIPAKNQETVSRTLDENDRSKEDKNSALDKSLLKGPTNRAKVKRKPTKTAKENKEPNTNFKRSKSKNKTNEVKFDKNAEDKPHKKLNQTKIELDKIRKKTEIDSEENYEKKDVSNKPKNRKGKTRNQGVKFAKDTEEKPHKKLNQTRIALEDIRKNKEKIESEDISEIKVPKNKESRKHKKGVKFNENTEEKPQKKLNQTRISLEEVRRKKQEGLSEDKSEPETPKKAKKKVPKSKKNPVTFDQDSEEKPHKKLNQTKIALAEIRKKQESSESESEEKYLSKAEDMKDGSEESSDSSSSSDSSYSEDSSEDSSDSESSNGSESSEDESESSNGSESSEDSDESSSQEIST